VGVISLLCFPGIVITQNTIRHAEFISPSLGKTQVSPARDPETSSG
jgi:hypothetical protein